MELLHKKSRNELGFTLVEMLVSLSLFTVVLTMSVGTLLVLIDANARAQNMQLIMSNLTFSLDSLTREVRTGTDWFCRGGNPSNIPTMDTNSPNATRDCTNLNGTSNKYISIIETGGSLTKNTATAIAQEGSGKARTARITYRFNNNYYGDGVGALLRALGGNNSSPDSEWVPITGSEIDIDVVELRVTGTDRHRLTGDTEQPTMTIYIKGTTGFDSQTKEFSLQTSVTQRSLDL